MSYQPITCEVCPRAATHVCSGLDVPALGFCDLHAAEHGRRCPDVERGASRVEKKQERSDPDRMMVDADEGSR